MPKEKKKELREIVKREMSGVEQWTKEESPEGRTRKKREEKEG